MYIFLKNEIENHPNNNKNNNKTNNNFDSSLVWALPQTKIVSHERTFLKVG